MGVILFQYFKLLYPTLSHILILESMRTLISRLQMHHSMMTTETTSTYHKDRENISTSAHVNPQGFCSSPHKHYTAAILISYRSLQHFK